MTDDGRRMFLCEPSASTRGYYDNAGRLLAMVPTLIGLVPAETCPCHEDGAHVHAFCLICPHCGAYLYVHPEVGIVPMPAHVLYQIDGADITFARIGHGPGAPCLGTGHVVRPVLCLDLLYGARPVAS